MPATDRNVPGQIQEPGTQSKTYTWVAGRLAIMPSFNASKKYVFIGIQNQNVGTGSQCGGILS